MTVIRSCKRIQSLYDTYSVTFSLQSGALIMIMIGENMFHYSIGIL